MLTSRLPVCKAVRVKNRSLKSQSRHEWMWVEIEVWICSHLSLTVLQASRLPIWILWTIALFSKLNKTKEKSILLSSKIHHQVVKSTTPTSRLKSLARVGLTWWIESTILDIHKTTACKILSSLMMI